MEKTDRNNNVRGQQQKLSGQLRKKKWVKYKSAKIKVKKDCVEKTKETRA